MRKISLAFFLTCVFVMLCTQIAFGYPLVDESTGTPIIGVGETTLAIEFPTTTPNSAIAIHGDADASIATGVASIAITKETSVSAGRFYGINVYGTSSQNASISILAPTFTISNSVAGSSSSYIGATIIAKYANFTAEGIFTLNNTGDYLIGIRAEDASNFTFKDAVVLTSTGNYSPAINTNLVNANTILTFKDDLTIETTGIWSHGMVLGNTANYKPIVTIDGDVSITTNSGGASGIHTNGYGELIIKGNLDVVTLGDSAYGIYLHDASGTRPLVNLSIEVMGDLSITTSGDYDFVAYSGSKGSYGIFVRAESFQTSEGLRSFNVPKLVVIHGDTTITTTGIEATAIELNNIEAVFGDTASNKTTIKVSGYGSSGIAISESIVTFGEVEVTSDSDAAYPVALNGISTIVTFRGKTTITTNKDISAILAQEGSSIVFKDEAIIKTSGEYASGIFMLGSTGYYTGYNYKGKIIFEDKATIETSGDNSHGMNIAYLSDVEFRGGGSIKTSGVDAYALYIGSGYDSVLLNDMLLESASGIVIANNGYSFGVTVTGESKLHGDVLNEYSLYLSKYGTVTLELSDQSYWRGGSSNALGDGAVNLYLSDSAYWDVVGDFRADLVDMADNSRILFSHPTAGSYYTASIGELTGSGTLVLNADVSTTLGSFDKIVIGKATGTFKLEIIDKTASGVDALTEELAIIEVTDISGSPIFSLVPSTGVVLGGSLYKLEKNGYVWQLVKSSVPEDIISGTNTSMIGLFELAKAIDASISDELLSTKKTVWVVAGYKRQNFRELQTNDTSKQNIFNLVTGMDVASKDDWNFGVFIGLTIGNQDVNDVIVSTTDAFTLGFNAVYEKNGLLASGFVRLASYLHRIEVIDDPDLMKGRLTTFGISASVQATKEFRVIHPSVYIAPKAKLSYTQIFGFKHDFDLLTVTGKPAAALVAWVGARIGKDIVIRDIPATVYGEAGFIYDTNPSITIFIDDEEKELKLDGKHYEFGVGFSVDPSSLSSFTFEYKFSISKNLVEPVKIKISATTSF